MKSFLIALTCALPLAAADSLVLRNATVHTVSGANVAAGSVVVIDGKIAEVGTKVAAPKGARVVDLKGLHVYPGLIDSATQLGLTEIGSVRETNDSADIGDFNPQLRAIVAVNPASEHIPVTRANGITTAVTAPVGGVFSGQAALIHLTGWTWEEMAVAPAISMQLQFPVIETPPFLRFMDPAAPRTPFAEVKRNYEKRLQELHEFVEQARRYQKAKAANLPGFEPDLKLEAMLPVLEGRMPVALRADRERAIREAMKFAEKEKLRIVLVHPEEAWKVAAELKAKDIPVILGPTLSLPVEEDDPYDKPYSTPGELYKAGVKFAFGSFSTSFARNLPYQAANAVAYGLPYNEALKAVTLNAAEIWGVADQVGSIDKGKWADLIVTDGDPLETRTQVKQAYIKGKPVDLENKHHRLYEIYSKRQ